MERPKTTSMLLASEWLTHVVNEAAWDEMSELVDSEPERAWHVIQLLIGAAPDYGVLSAVAAGPLEDLIDQHGDAFMPRIAEKAKTSARLRICLRGVNSDLPPELSAIVEAEAGDVRALPVEAEASATGDDLALIIAWLHHSDTAWSFVFLKEMTVNDAASAWDVLRVLLVFAEEDPRIQCEVFDEAFEPFMRRHFTDFRDRFVEAGRKSAAFRRWARDRRRPPIDDELAWGPFVSELPAR